MATTTTTALQASASCSNLYDTPVHDAVCAMPNTGNYTQLMFDCCKKASVVSYYNGCGLYCLAVDQSVSDLTACLYEKGAAWGDVFCRGNVSATATGASDQIPASASAVALSSTRSTTAATSTSSTGAKNGASSAQPKAISTVSLFLITALFSSSLLATLQL